jgi:hypothetical protein
MTDYLRNHASNAIECPRCAQLRIALDQARAHARGAAKREAKVKEDAYRMASQLQSLRDRLKTATGKGV